MSGLPSIVFGLVALGPALLALLLPDTSRAPLPDDLAEAENIDKMVTDEDMEAGDVTPPASIAMPAVVVTAATGQKEG